jgi:DNA-binding PadR family transcriptional regulator
MCGAAYAFPNDVGGCRGRHAALAGVGLLAMSGRGRGRHRSAAGYGRGPLFVGAPGGFRRGPRARRGDVRAAALVLLAEGPRNGYQLMQEIEERSNGVWRPSAGSMYPALSQLEDEGLVRVDEQEGRRTFVLTDAGRTYVEERRAELGAPWEEISGAVDDDVAGLFGEIRRVAVAAAQIGHMGNPSQVAEARRQLGELRRRLYGLLAEDESERPRES